MSLGGCSLCVGALPEGEWCRACGFGQVEPAAPEQPQAPLLEAVRQARGGLRGDEIKESIDFLNRASALIHGASKDGEASCCCRICGRALDPDASCRSPALDCGGDCAGCMYEMEVLMGCPRDQLGCRPRGIPFWRVAGWWLRRWASKGGEARGR